MTGKAHILIVEDEPSVAENILYALRTEGLEPEWVSTGQEALGRLRAEGFDLVVLDVGLPDGSGFDVCKELRGFSKVPVIFLTARSDEIDRVVGLEIGADDYVTKPFSPRELAARVRAVLRRSGDAEPDAVRSLPGLPFRIDTDRQRILYFEQPLPLTRLEFRLLEVLLRKPGRIYSRDLLMSLAWDEPDASLDRTVDAHVKSLRAKLRAVRDDVEAIVTHRGVGYTLKEDW